MIKAIKLNARLLLMSVHMLSKEKHLGMETALGLKSYDSDFKLQIWIWIWICLLAL